MIFTRISEITYEDFSVTDSSDNLVSGLDSTSFTTHLFDADGNEANDATTFVNITELGYGHYRCSFIPNRIGMWYLIVYHQIYFPWGKSGSIQVFANDFDSITTMITRILGLVQEDFYLDNTIYDGNNNMLSGRIRIYSDSSSVGTSNNVIDTYNITAVYSGKQMTSYSVVKQ